MPDPAEQSSTTTATTKPARERRPRDVSSATRPRYPIIDWRGLESLGRDESPPCSIAYWLAYVNACRELAHHAGVTMRVLDKALWQYSRERPRA